MRSLPADLDCPIRPGESFTARTLRLRVRANPVETAEPPAPVAVVDEAQQKTQPDLQPGPPTSDVAPGMLLVRIQAESASAFDTDDGMPATGDLIATPRLGISGTIAAIAGSAPGFAVGDEVFGVTSTRPFNGADRLALVEARHMARMPSRLGFSAAAAAALAGTSAWQMLFKIGRIDAGETVLVLGAETPVGAFAVQLAALHGVRTIAIVASPGSDEGLFLRGADRIADASPGVLEAQCRSVSLVVDTVGGALHQRAAASLQSGCTLVSCVERPDVFTAARRRIRSLYCIPEATTQCLAGLASLIDEAYVATRAIASEPGHG